MTADDRTAIRKTARVAGGLYLSLVPLGIISFVYVPSLVLVPGNAAATAGNILASERVFRLGTASHLLSQVIVVFFGARAVSDPAASECGSRDGHGRPGTPVCPNLICRRSERSGRCATPCQLRRRIRGLSAARRTSHAASQHATEWGSSCPGVLGAVDDSAGDTDLHLGLSAQMAGSARARRFGWLSVGFECAYSPPRPRDDQSVHCRWGDGAPAMAAGEGG
jgi:hypothetical protein